MEAFTDTLPIVCNGFKLGHPIPCPVESLRWLSDDNKIVHYYSLTLVQKWLVFTLFIIGILQHININSELHLYLC